MASYNQLQGETDMYCLGRAAIQLISLSLMAVWFSGTALAAGKDAGHSNDYRTFHQDGTIDYGDIGDSYTADLVLYLAGNQFMVMEELIKDFLSKHPDIKFRFG